MIKISHILIPLLVVGVGLAAQETVVEPILVTAEQSDGLAKALLRYLDFSNRMGKGEVFSQNEEEALLASDCKKIFNGHLFTKTSDAFVAEFRSIYQNYGGWKTTPVDVIKVPSEQKMILRLLIESENFGMGTAIAILRYDSSFRITELNEVFSQVLDFYDFKN